MGSKSKGRKAFRNSQRFHRQARKPLRVPVGRSAPVALLLAVFLLALLSCLSITLDSRNRGAASFGLEIDAETLFLLLLLPCLLLDRKEPRLLCLPMLLFSLFQGLRLCYSHAHYTLFAYIYPLLLFGCVLLLLLYRRGRIESRIPFLLYAVLVCGYLIFSSLVSDGPYFYGSLVAETDSFYLKRGFSVGGYTIAVIFLGRAVTACVFVLVHVLWTYRYTANDSRAYYVRPKGQCYIKYLLWGGARTDDEQPPDESIDAGDRGVSSQYELPADAPVRVASDAPQRTAERGSGYDDSDAPLPCAGIVPKRKKAAAPVSASLDEDEAPVLPDAEEVDFTSTLHKSPRKHAATSRRYLSAEDMLGNGPEHEYGTDSRFEAGDAPPRRKPR